MNKPILPLFVAGLCVLAGGAQAQNFFERLFGIVPSRPEPPPVVYQRPPPPPEGFGGEEPVRRAPAAASPPRPASVKAPSEDSVIGREVKQNGSSGSMRIERAGPGDYRVRLTLVGRRAADSLETCRVVVGGPGGLPLVSQGRPEGTLRFQVQDPSCPMQLDLLEESVLVKGSSDVCVFADANCRADPSGLWGPEPSSLVPRTRDFDTIRASADKAARDNYKVLTQRARPDAVRSIVAEQAAFSADREQVCRNYARESAHGFCNARFSEGRALALMSRLGVTSSTQTAESPRRSRRAPVEEELPSSDDLMSVR